jgi:hypothetical protein
MSNIPIKEGDSRWVLRISRGVVLVAESQGILPRQLAAEYLGLDEKTPEEELERRILSCDPLADVIVMTRTDLGIGINGQSDTLGLPAIREMKGARKKTMGVLRKKFPDEKFFEVKT